MDLETDLWKTGASFVVSSQVSTRKPIARGRKSCKIKSEFHIYIARDHRPSAVVGIAEPKVAELNLIKLGLSIHLTTPETRRGTDRPFPSSWCQTEIPGSSADETCSDET